MRILRDDYEHNSSIPNEDAKNSKNQDSSINSIFTSVILKTCTVRSTCRNSALTVRSIEKHKKRDLSIE